MNEIEAKRREEVDNSWNTFIFLDDIYPVTIIWIQSFAKIRRYFYEKYPISMKIYYAQNIYGAKLFFDLSIFLIILYNFFVVVIILYNLK